MHATCLHCTGVPRHALHIWESGSCTAGLDWDLFPLLLKAYGVLEDEAVVIWATRDIACVVVLNVWRTTYERSARNSGSPLHAAASFKAHLALTFRVPHDWQVQRRAHVYPTGDFSSVSSAMTCSTCRSAP